MDLRKYTLPSLIFLMLAVFVLYPTFSVLARSLTVDGRFGLDNFVILLTETHFSETIWASALVALGAASLATLLGLIIAVTVHKTTLPMRRFLAGAAVMPLIIPGFVSTLAYIFLFGRNGLITYQWLGITWDIYSWKSVLLIQTLDFTAIAFLLVTAVIIGLDSRVEDAARNLGASEWEVLTTVTLPLLRPGIIAALLLSFLRSLADFGTPLILGGNFDTLASASYTQIIGVYNMDMAATLNAALLILCLLVFWFYARAQRLNDRVRTQTGGERKPLALNRSARSIFWTVSMLFAFSVCLLLASVMLASFTKHLGANFTLTLEHFQILPQRGWNSTLNTLIFASITALVMSLLGLVIAYLVTRFQFHGKRLLDIVTTLPFAIPGTMLGIGYALAFSRSPLLLTGTWGIVLALTVIRELPLGMRSGVSVLTQQDRGIEDAARSLGASRVTSFTGIIMPLAKPALIVSALYAFVATVQTVGAIIFVVTPGTKLLSVDVFEAVYRGDVGDAAALSTVMLLISAIGVLGIYLIIKREVTKTWLKKILATRNVA